jgi:predicted phosphodiesterase
MKWITIGDIHGRDNWKSIDINQYDKVIFMGDYVDGREELDELKNLEEIIDLKLNYPDKVVLLVGNHDLQYHWHSSRRLRVYKEKYAFDYQRLFKQYEEHFQLSYYAFEHLWVHAGITTRWLQFMQMHGHDFSECKTKDLSLQLNHLFEKDCKELYSVGKARGGLDVGGPFWADISELRMSAAPIHQIVGHNKTETPMHHELERGSFRMADCLTHCNQFWVYQPMELSWSKEIIALGK